MKALASDRVRTSLFAIGVACLPAIAGAQGCENPSTPRVFVLNGNEGAEKVDEVAMRSSQIAKAIGEAMIAQMGASACILRKASLLDDQQNFPALRGSTVVNISVQASRTNLSFAAVAVDFEAVQSHDATKNFQLGSVPLLLEPGKTYSALAEGALRYWSFIGKAFAGEK